MKITGRNQPWLFIPWLSFPLLSILNVSSELHAGPAQPCGGHTKNLLGKSASALTLIKSGWCRPQLQAPPPQWGLSDREAAVGVCGQAWGQARTELERT